MWARRTNWFTLIMLLCLGATACTAMFRSYGRFIPSTEVTKELEGYMVNPDFRYYISGPDMNPNALMGLDRTYRIDPETLWREVNMSPPKMREIVEGMKTKVSVRPMVLYGFTLTDNNGRPIGLWYSILEARTFLRMNEDGTVRIDTPDLHTYERAGGDSLHDRDVAPHYY